MNEKKLNIVFITNNYTPYQGGVVKSIQTTSHALQQQGHRVTIITLDFIDTPLYEPHVIRIFCPVRFMYKKNHMALPLWPQTHLTTIFDSLKPDIVHIHHPFLLGPAALSVAKKKRIPTVFTHHTLYEQYLHYIPLPQQLTKPVVTKLVHSFCTEVDAIIAPGTFIKTTIEQAIAHTRIEVIPSSINDHFFAYQPCHELQEPYRLLTVSRFTPEKNLTFLLDVMTLLEPTRFTLTLAGYGYEYDYLKHYAYTLRKLSPQHVSIIEKPSPHTLLELYQKAHLFLFASLSDTQGIVLAEAMAQATPVIALDGPGQRDIIQHGLNGFLVHSRQEMKNAIITATSNKEVLATMQQEALKTAKRYQSTHLIQKLTDLYRTLL